MGHAIHTANTGVSIQADMYKFLSVSPVHLNHVVPFTFKTISQMVDKMVREEHLHMTA